MKSKILQNNSTARKNIFVFIILCITTLIPGSVCAQQSMTGGGYTLNGGLTSTGDNLSGGGYTLNTQSDSATNQSTAGSYSFEPTPFSGSGTNSETGSNNVANNSTQVSAQSGGFQNITTQQDTNKSGTILPKNRPVFSTSKNLNGVEWIDIGFGVDSNFDGVSDIGRGTSSGQMKTGAGPGDPDAISSTISTNQKIKIFSGLPLGHIIVLVVFLLSICFIRIVRRVPDAPRSSMAGNMQVCKVSRRPIAILVDYIVLFHKFDQNHKEANPVISDYEFEKKLHETMLDTSSLDIVFFIILDQFLVPTITLISIIVFGPLSSILGFLIALTFIARVYIVNQLGN